ncbi:membrane protein insertion efficiency factor YidD [Candidatus Roizmanbacteria bacterium CG03_land_8_20_14_0_80_39_12]|uniref:Putative membrane protein insertion efficiency factor n=1 Tax=Candidatus Roizmanbacteria bacterium CG03_land_8_20_14_0_80_39_12 TaxID=1974847 RepID=A0A2M7BR95_9BACT|nr:MAG: membrane protein insertion efficiency factor YidD [Candidatus Roizmanbacteria bacterium CG03_land_8_20_14_0_80_39_12]
MKQIVLRLIRWYQSISFFQKYMGVSCRFYPTCSDYTFEAVDKYGIVKGLVLGLYRVLRCNPFNKGGIDKP